MHNFKLFEEYTRRKSLWRNTSEEFLQELLDKGKVSSKNRKYISLSFDKDSGGLDDYGKVKIEFDADILFKQGAIEIDYEDSEFWIEYPDIAKHVTGFSSAKEYYDNNGYADAADANKNFDLTWEQNCEGYQDEEEVVIPEIKLEDGLIKSIVRK